MRAALYIVGALLEFTGIVLVGSPDIAPYATRLSAWLTGTAQNAFDRVLGLFGRHRSRGVVVGVADAMATMRGGVRRMTSVNPQATPEERVDFLLARDQEAQRDLAALGERVEVVQEESAAKLDELRAQMEARIAAAFEEAHKRYLGLRWLGLGALFGGLILTTWANFV